MEGVRVLRTCNDAKYVTHTGVSPKYPTERRPTRDGRYRQDLLKKNAEQHHPHHFVSRGSKREQNIGVLGA